MEYLQVFDDDKNMLYEKIARSNKHDLESGKNFMIVLLFIENSEGKFLMQKTSKAKGSVIATTGGHVTYGDDGITTVLKEAKEELDLDLSKEEVKYISTVKYPGIFCEVYYTKKDVDLDKVILQESEVESVMWASTKDIEKFIEEETFRKSNIEPFNMIINKTN